MLDRDRDLGNPQMASHWDRRYGMAPTSIGPLSESSTAASFGEPAPLPLSESSNAASFGKQTVASVTDRWREGWRGAPNSQCGAVGLKPASHGLATRVRASARKGGRQTASPERLVVARRPRGPTAGCQRYGGAGQEGRPERPPLVHLLHSATRATGGTTREGRTVHGICTPHPQGHVPSGEAGMA